MQNEPIKDKPVKDENLRLIYTEVEKKHISSTLKEEHQNIIINIILLFLFPFLSWFLEHGEDSIANSLGRNFGNWAEAVAGVITLIGILAPIPILIIIAITIFRLRKYKNYQQEHRGFLKKYDRR